MCLRKTYEYEEGMNKKVIKKQWIHNMYAWGAKKSMCVCMLFSVSLKHARMCAAFLKTSNGVTYVLLVSSILSFHAFV